MADNNHLKKVFDYRALRLILGFIAFSLPFVVSIMTTTRLTSISASYFTESRDVFVGMLCIVGAFLFAYNGHNRKEALISKLAAIAAICVAFFPTTCDTCSATTNSYVHYSAAAILFSILAFFCFGPFRYRTKDRGGKKGMRSKIYFLCGWVMLVCMLSIAAASFILEQSVVSAYRITFWAEAIALSAFGIAWIVAGKYFGFFVDERDNQLKIFSKYF